MSEEGFTKVRRGRETAQPPTETRRNLAVFAVQRGTEKDKSVRYVRALMIVLESSMRRDNRGRPIRGADGSPQMRRSAALPTELPDVSFTPELVKRMLHAYLPDLDESAVSVDCTRPYVPVYDLRPDEMVQEYVLATVEFPADKPIPEFGVTPEDCPEAMWASWYDVDTNFKKSHDSVLRSLRVLYMAISWTQGRVPSIVRDWVKATRPALGRSAAATAASAPAVARRKN